MMIDRLSWSTVVHQHSPTGNVRNLSNTISSASTAKITTPAGASEIAKAREAFTAMVIQSFLDAAIPKNISGAGRAGAANTMWRSLLVEQLARTVAASGQFDVLGGAKDTRLVGSIGAPSISAGHSIQGRENVNESV